MNHTKNLHLAVPPPMSGLGEAIGCWLVARDKAIAVTSSENQHAYNATLFELGAAWAERYPEGVATPGAFEWYRLGLIEAEEA